MNFIIGRVTTVVLGEYFDDGKIPNPDYSNPSDTGKITFEILYSGLNVAQAKSVSKDAYPMFSFIKQYPLIGEIVYIVTGPSDKLNDSYNAQKFFYYPPFGLWNSTNHNAFPNMEQYGAFVKKSSTDPGPYQGTTDAASIKLPLGVYFSENKKVKSLKAFEGDSLIEGRFGQTIRFGSSNSLRKDNDTWSIGSQLTVGSNTGVDIRTLADQEDISDSQGKPITIIVNGQGTPSVKNADIFSSTIEDISRDDSSIYLTSGQVLRTLSVSDIVGAKKYDFPYKGNQALICSDRVMLYSKNENILLLSRKDVGISANSNINLNSTKTISVESPRIELGGSSAIEPAMLGNDFTSKLIELLETFIIASNYIQNSSESDPATTAINIHIGGLKMLDASQKMLDYLKTEKHLSKITYLK
jgi:hypothetical protein